MPTATELARAFKAAIDRQDAAALTRLAKTYSQLYGRMQGKLDSLLLAISKLEEPTSGQVMRLAQYKNLINALESELTKYSAYVEVEIRNTFNGKRRNGSQADRAISTGGRLHHDPKLAEECYLLDAWLFAGRLAALETNWRTRAIQHTEGR